MAGSGFRLSVPAHLRPSLMGWVGKRVVLGIRPEHLSLDPAPRVRDEDVAESAGTMMDMEAKLNIVEPLGSATDLYVETRLHDRVVARVEADRELVGLSVGSPVRLYADGRKIHFFEPGETGMNLSLTTSEPSHANA